MHFWSLLYRNEHTISAKMKKIAGNSLYLYIRKLNRYQIIKNPMDCLDW